MEQLALDLDQRRFDPKRRAIEALKKRRYRRGAFDKFMFPLIRRMADMDFIDRLAGVQPMMQPDPAVMYMDIVHGPAHPGPAVDEPPVWEPEPEPEVRPRMFLRQALVNEQRVGVDFAANELQADVSEAVAAAANSIIGRICQEAIARVAAAQKSDDHASPDGRASP